MEAVAIAVIAGGAFVGFVVVPLLAYIRWRRRKRNQR